ncbi:MAG: hypothetical protein QOD85_85, partial [Gaiellaceae bacterium]|nr:hypothetical protein [Gaiellaceae bacterium]
RELVELVTPAAAELGCSRELEGVEALLERGSGADEQRRAQEADGSLLSVARWLADGTVEGLGSRGLGYPRRRLAPEEIGRRPAFVAE